MNEGQNPVDMKTLVTLALIVAGSTGGAKIAVDQIAPEPQNVQTLEGKVAEHIEATVTHRELDRILALQRREILQEIDQKYELPPQKTKERIAAQESYLERTTDYKRPHYQWK